MFDRKVDGGLMHFFVLLLVTLPYPDHLEVNKVANETVIWPDHLDANPKTVSANCHGSGVWEHDMEPGFSSFPWKVSGCFFNWGFSITWKTILEIQCLKNKDIWDNQAQFSAIPDHLCIPLPEPFNNLKGFLLLWTSRKTWKLLCDDQKALFYTPGLFRAIFSYSQVCSPI